MTGWRVGWLVARRDLAEKAAQLNEFIVSHATSFIQRAAQSALAQGEDDLQRMLERLKDNRDFCLAALRQVPGVTVPSPDGAFYVFPRIAGLTDSFAFCWRLLHETKVGIAPGVAFGAGGKGPCASATLPSGPSWSPPWTGWSASCAPRGAEEAAMSAALRHAADPSRVLTIIMGGGQGARLFPLTRERAKPAVPLAGKYRLVDIPISNCINSGMRRIYLLTQFLSASLHRHVYGSFKFDHFSPGFVEILAAEQTHTDTSWYQGTADAVRKNLIHFRERGLRLRLDPERRSALPDGFPENPGAARRDEGRPHHLHHPGEPERRPIAGHHADRCRAADRPLRGEAEGARPARQPQARSRLVRPARHPGRSGVLPGLDGHLPVQSRGAVRAARQLRWRISASTSSPRPSRTIASSPTSFRATGRTSGPSARSSRPTWTSPPSCRASTSST